MANGTIHNPAGALTTGTVTALSGYAVSNYSVQRIGRICVISIPVSKSSGTIPGGGNVSTVANIADGFRPAADTETAVLITSSMNNATFKAKILTNGNIELQGTGTSLPTWINVVAVYVC